MGPQHPSTHGVLRLILEIDGETVTEARCGIGYLHTGIEKNLEFRTWTQGTTFVTRMDYLTPFFNETAYCLGVEKLLGIEDQIPDRATVIRVLLMELNRLSSHLVCIATGGMELGATTIMIYGFRDRELILDIYELITGLRMNHAYIRPGGLAQDLPPGAVDQIREFVKKMKKNLPEYDKLATGNPIFKARMQDVGYLDLAGCMALGATGPILRSAGLPHDLRKSAAVLRLRELRLRRPDRRHLRLLRPLPDPPGGDAPVAADRRAVPGPARSPARSWSPTRRSPGPRSSPWARTASATRSTTSRRSWAPPWRP